jgi:hypothetical protein
MLAENPISQEASLLKGAIGFGNPPRTPKQGQSLMEEKETGL